MHKVNKENEENKTQRKTTIIPHTTLLHLSQNYIREELID